MINLFFEDVQIPDLSSEFFCEWMSRVCSLENKKLGEVSLIFCSDDYLLEMNKDYLEHDYFTDIITFDYTEGILISGDLFISLDRVKDNASNEGVELMEEINRVCVHGLLHLIGYKDKDETESKLMREKEDWALSLIVSRETLN